MNTQEKINRIKAAGFRYLKMYNLSDDETDHRFDWKLKADGVHKMIVCSVPGWKETNALDEAIDSILQHPEFLADKEQMPIPDGYS